MSVSVTEMTRGGYTVKSVRVDGALTHVVLERGYASMIVKPSLEALTFLRHAADVIDQSIAFDGCERPVTKEDTA